MNPVVLTEDILRSIDLAYPDMGRAEAIAGLPLVKAMSLLTFDAGKFTVEELTNRMDQFISGQSDLEKIHTMFRTPFPKFRFWVNIPARGVYYGVCERSETELRILVVQSDFVPNGSGFDYRNKLILKIFHQCCPSKPGVLDWRVRAFRHHDGKEITEGQYGSKLLRPQLQELLDRAVCYIIYYMALLSEEYLAPHNHSAVVHPDKPGKSVQWVQAREHYTLIHRTHAANSPGVAHGGTVVQDPGKHLERIAHSRRAHTRVLRSDKYKGMRGKTIHIKSTWVGPKEWKDTAGQIYRIVG